MGIKYINFKNHFFKNLIYPNAWLSILYFIVRKTKLIFKDDEETEINELWKTNVMGPWFLTRAVWEELKKNQNSRISYQ